MLMKQNRKAQGLPLNTIVLAALALLVLVVIATFAMGGFGRIFGGIARITPKASDLQAVKTECQNYCLELEMISSVEEYANSRYCSATFDIDINGNGQIDEGEPTGVHCWESPVNVPCTKRVTKYSGGVTEIVTCSPTGTDCSC